MGLLNPPWPPSLLPIPRCALPPLRLDVDTPAPADVAVVAPPPNDWPDVPALDEKALDGLFRAGTTRPRDTSSNGSSNVSCPRPAMPLAWKNWSACLPKAASTGGAIVAAPPGAWRGRAPPIVGAPPGPVKRASTGAAGAGAVKAGGRATGGASPGGAPTIGPSPATPPSCSATAIESESPWRLAVLGSRNPPVSIDEDDDGWRWLFHRDDHTEASEAASDRASLRVGRPMSPSLTVGPVSLSWPPPAVVAPVVLE
mmetsp:Transcript_30890/g.76648  ORF Transcript_30890/g.76648 Transcript_30890/m.76648 type:complete len:256 (-) Transcript_30890:1080-1847(-)